MKGEMISTRGSKRLMFTVGLIRQVYKSELNTIATYTSNTDQEGTLEISKLITCYSSQRCSLAHPPRKRCFPVSELVRKTTNIG